MIGTTGSGGGGSMAMAASNIQLSANVEQFPDLLQYLPPDECIKLVDIHASNYDVINKKGTNGGYTALHWSCIKNDAKLARHLLLDCKADVNARANQGETALHICTKNLNFYLIELLISNGADVNMRDTYNRSVMHWAAYTGRTILIHYYERYHNLSVNDADQFKQNPLHIACGSQHVNLANYLITTKKISLYEQDFNGNTCLHMAAKGGLLRISWLIVKQAGKRIVNIENGAHQKPFDLITNDTSKTHRSIRDWLKYESTNTNDTYSKLNLCLLWLWCLMIPAYAYTLPLIVNRVLFGTDVLTLSKGLISYGSIVLMFVAFSRQSHRLNHVSGMTNPFYLGFYLSIFIHNYSSFYVYYYGLIDSSLAKLFAVTITLVHGYSYLYLIFSGDPGYAIQNCRKRNGDEFTLKDFIHEKWFNAEGSGTALNTADDDRQHMFCESCVLVADTITKHCKLCEKCCLRFDHHCLFLNKCIGLKNHKIFLLLIFTSVLCMILYLTHAFVYFQVEYAVTRDTSFLYVLLACTTKCYLLNVTSYGFTSQFRPHNMSVMNIRLTDRLRNLYIFLFKSYSQLEDLYFKNFNLCNEMMASKRKNFLQHAGCDDGCHNH